MLSGAEDAVDVVNQSISFWLSLMSCAGISCLLQLFTYHSHKAFAFSRILRASVSVMSPAVS